MGKTNRNIPEPGSKGQFPQTPGSLPSGWRPSLLGAVPLPVFIGLVTVFDIVLPSPAQLGSGLRFEPPYLSALLYTVFISLTSFLVTYISLKGYVQSGSAILLLLGSAALAWGSSTLVGTWLGNLPAGPNVGITIVNTGALFASLFHVASGSLASTGASLESGPGVRKSLSVLAYSGVLSFVALFTVASLEGFVPAFFVLGVGQTPIRMVVVGSSAALFAISAFMFGQLCFSSRSKILYWYFLALGMTSVGLLAIFFGRAPGDPISWTGRAAQFLGGVYFLKAVLTTFRAVRPGGA